MTYIVNFTKVKWKIGNRSEQFNAETLFPMGKCVPTVILIRSEQFKAYFPFFIIERVFSI